MVGPAIAFGLAGLVIGSFVGVVAHRIPRGEGIIAGRSRCDHCGEQVAAYDNVPVLSWLLLRGRCRHCAEPIPVLYPLVELALAALFVASYLVFEDDAGDLALALVFVSVLAAITLTDVEHRIIPNKILRVAAIAGLAIAIPTDPGSWDERLIAVAAVAGPIFLIALMHPQGMGMGDAKLLGVMGIFLGRAVAPALVAGLLAGGAVALGLLARYGKAARKQAVPFGPFLALGGLVGLFLGDEIVDWYLDEFFPDE